jgi:hypothetical protein
MMRKEMVRIARIASACAVRLAAAHRALSRPVTPLSQRASPLP